MFFSLACCHTSQLIQIRFGASPVHSGPFFDSVRGLVTKCCGQLLVSVPLWFGLCPTIPLSCSNSSGLALANFASRLCAAQVHQCAKDLGSSCCTLAQRQDTRHALNVSSGVCSIGRSSRHGLRNNRCQVFFARLGKRSCRSCGHDPCVVVPPSAGHVLEPRFCGPMSAHPSFAHWIQTRAIIGVLSCLFFSLWYLSLSLYQPSSSFHFDQLSLFPDFQPFQLPLGMVGSGVLLPWCD